MTTSFVYKPQPTQIDAITVDATVLEVHTTTVEVTDHPVESGAEVSDHARVRPFELRVEGVLTDTPLSSVQHKRKLRSGAVTIDSATYTDVPDGQPGAAITAYDRLRMVQLARVLITVVTKLRTYKDMLITSLEVPRDGRTGDSVKFTALMRQMKVVSAQQVVIAQEPRAKKQVRKGPVVKEEVKAPEPLVSWAKEAGNSEGLSKATGMTPGSGVR